MKKATFSNRSKSRLVKMPLIAAFGVALTLAGFHKTGAQPPKPRIFEKVDSVALVPSPGWTISGTWTSGGSSLTLVDARANKLLEYGLDGRLIRDIAGPLEGTIQFPLPSILQRAFNGYLLEDEDGHFVWLDQDLRPYKQMDLNGISNGEATLGAVYGWTVVGDSILAFTDIEKKNGDWSSALLVIPVAAPTGFRIMYEMDISHEGRKFYHFGNPYLATVDEYGYFIVMEQEPFIMQVAVNSAGEGRVTRKFKMPAEFERLPDLPEKKDAASTLEIFKLMERSTMPTGLYGAADSLFVVGRVFKSGVPSGTWRAVRLSTQAGAAASSFEFKSAAKHLTVIPGPIRWAFIERGPVVQLGEQKIDSLFFLQARDLLLDR